MLNLHDAVTKNDFAALAALQGTLWSTRFFPEMRAEEPRLHEKEREAYWTELVLPMVKHGHRAVLGSVQGRLCGYCHFAASRGSAPDEFTQYMPTTRSIRGRVTSTEWECLAIGVLDGFRGLGLGRAMMNHVLQSSGRLTCGLWVATGNERARRFYEQGGWKYDGSERDLIDGVSEVRMVLEVL